MFMLLRLSFVVLFAVVSSYQFMPGMWRDCFCVVLLTLVVLLFIVVYMLLSKVVPWHYGYFCFYLFSFTRAVIAGSLSSQCSFGLKRKEQETNTYMVKNEAFTPSAHSMEISRKSRRVRLGASSGVSLFCGECTPASQKNTQNGCKNNACSCHLTGVCTCAACSCGVDCPCRRSASADSAKCGCTPVSKCSNHQ